MSSLNTNLDSDQKSLNKGSSSTPLYILDNKNNKTYSPEALTIFSSLDKKYDLKDKSGIDTEGSNRDYNFFITEIISTVEKPNLLKRILLFLFY